VPSLVELGVFPEQYVGWTGLFAPANTPESVRAKLLSMVNEMLKTSGGEEIKHQGYRPASPSQGPRDFPQFVAENQKLWLSTFQKVGIPPLQ
jgi:tripartite-type tricarboxylate transporter receptor subunit TctC